MRIWKFAAALALLAPAIPASAAEPVLKATPSATALSLKAGVSQINDYALAYVPKNVSGPAPLILLLGGGQGADDFLNLFRSEADHRGAILLAVQPASGSWTLKPDGKGGADFGTDPEAIDAALSALFAKAPVDPARTVVLGYSSGASSALSLGFANPKLFRGIVALTPTTAWLAGTVDTTQKIFVSHGMRDDVVPFKNTRDTIVPGLEKAGFKVKTHWPNNGHDIDKHMIEEGLDEVLGK